ncbi:MAG TPA: FG-GAP repeat protein [Phycisphaerales bacterium]|nr:FG-GAP repeat protein [Phycisphaerales bacterium]
MREHNGPAAPTRRTPMRTPCIIAAMAGLSGAASAQWLDIARIGVGHGRSADEFGHAVAASGQTLVVGAYGEDHAGLHDVGAAYLFSTAVPADPELRSILRASDSGEHGWFGYCVAIGRDLCLVGGPRAAIEGLNAGAAYVFDVGNGLELSKIVPPEPVAWGDFGRSVALRAEIALIGSSGAGGGAGAAYLYELHDPSRPVLLGVLTPEPGSDGDDFGWCVRLGDGTAFVGSPGGDGTGADRGAVYLFDITDPSAPVLAAKVQASDGEDHDRFGSDLAIDGSLALIGRPPSTSYNTDVGSAYVFDVHDPFAPVQLSKIEPADGEQWDFFGDAVALRGEAALVGSSYDSNGMGLHAGAVYMYDLSDPAAPLQTAKLTDRGGGSYQGFGTSVLLSGDLVIVGAPFSTVDDDGVSAGAVSVLAPCPANFNRDHSLDSRDVLAFLNAWAAEGQYNCAFLECASDFNADGRVDSEDVLAFLNAWNRGC